MKKTTLFAALAAVTILAGCKPAAEPEPSAAPDAAATAPSDIQQPTADGAAPAGTNAAPVEIATAAEGGTPHLLSAGTSLSGQFAAPQAGDIHAVGLQVGNYDGSSDGTATLKACQADKCMEGSADIVGSTDNAYLTFKLAGPLTVTAGAQVVYTFTRVDGAKPFALWTYPTQAQGEVTLPDGSKAARDAKVAVTY
jgi:hypothetical protein